MENTLSSANVNAIAYGDIDNDGDLDLVHASANDVFWIENVDGQNTEVLQHLISDDGFQDLSIVDIDNDGDLDITGQSGRRIIWLENSDGLGTFNAAMELFNTNSSSSPIYAHAAADLDVDGDIDILVSYKGDGNSQPLSWLENTDGQGTFALISIDDIAYADSLFVADIDGDDDMDIFTYDSFDDEIAWYTNDGNQVFTDVPIISNNGSTLVFVADIDGDNVLDLVTTFNYSADINWFKDIDGTGNFVSQQHITTENVSTINSMAVEDVDNDGDLDILYTKFYNDTISWYENTDGLGNFATRHLLSDRAQGPVDIIVYDYDNDGDNDVLSASRTDDKIAWYAFDNGTHSTENVITTSINSPGQVVAKDIDNDGALDVVSASHVDNKLAWYKNLDGQGKFGPQQLLDGNLNTIETFSIEDIDNDGDLDIVAGESNGNSSNRLLWYENMTGIGDFNTGHVIFDFYAEIHAIDVVDLDSDGNMDIVFSTGESIGFHLNQDGLGNFGALQTISAPLFSGGTKLFSKDINGDSHLDIIAQSSSGQSAWYPNDGSANFTTGNFINSSIADPAFTLNVEDVDGDGDIDIISSLNVNNFNDAEISWYENVDGLGTFGTKQLISDVLNSIVTSSFSDMDNDGDLDLITGSYTKVAWFENLDGLGGFGAEQIISLNDNISNTAFVSDINNDGKPDVLSSNFFDNYAGFSPDDKIVWYEAIGFGSNEIYGNVRIDDSADGCDETDDALQDLMIITYNNNETLATFTQSSGYYQLFPSIGDYTTTIAPSQGTYYSAEPNSYSATFNDVGETINADFCLTVNDYIDDLDINIVPTSDARPGFNATYNIVYKNTGTTVLDGTIGYQYDDAKLSFVSASETIISQTSNELTFDFFSLNASETRTIDLEFTVFPPPTVNIGDMITHITTITPDTSDPVIFAFNQTVIGSYDPNDITVLEGREILFSEVDNYLHYVIRFQNTGTASAINVSVENSLDPKLDWTTLELVNLSHSGQVAIENGNRVIFTFNNINLPDSTTDEEGSNGFIAYKIKPISTVAIGDSMLNNANIYFDYNTAIATNTVSTTIVEDNLSVESYLKTNFKVFPNPTEGTLNIVSKAPISIYRLYNTLGQLILSNSNNVIDMSSVKSGLYILNVEDLDGHTASIRVVKK